MSFKCNNFGKKCLPPGSQFMSIGELNELLDKKDLTENDIKYLHELRKKWYTFRNDRMSINAFSFEHHNEPSTIIFMDIKGTLYTGGTHFNGVGILNRSVLDSIPISLEEINAFGDIIKRAEPQDFDLPDRFNKDYELVPYNSEFGRTIEKRIPIPMEKRGRLTKRPPYTTKNGPFTIVFISSDDVKTQKTIVSLLYYVALFEDKMRGSSINHLFGIDPSKYTDLSTDFKIADIEKTLLKYDNDFDRFLEMEDKNFANLSDFHLKSFKDTIDRLFFFSTSETGKTKLQLMEEFLESDERRLRAGSNYNVFAIGDSYSDDCEMIKRAYLEDGYGYFIERESYNYSTYLAKELYEKGINLGFLPTVSSISEFNKNILKELMAQRENELITAMTYANHDEESDYVFDSSVVQVALRKKR